LNGDDFDVADHEISSIIRGFLVEGVEAVVVDWRIVFGEEGLL
jgi:hypothetical protein